MTALALARLKGPARKPVGRVPGLYLYVQDSGAKSWILKVVIGGKRREIGLGSYPALGLADARVNAEKIRQSIRLGVDPVEEKRRARAELKAKAAAGITFERAARAYLTTRPQDWLATKNAAQWAATLELHAFPRIGQVKLEEIATDHVLAVLEPIWHEKTETASRLRGRIETVIAWADKRAGRERLNPARWRGHLDAVLPAVNKVAKKQHFPAVQVKDAPAFLRELRLHEGMGSRALEFLLFTNVRSANVREATWSEIDLNSRVWRIPGEKMKAGTEHRVPLPEVAVELLKALPRMHGSDLVFPAPRGGVLSDMTLSQVMKRLAFKDVEGRVTVPHGLRSTFRDWAAEHTHHPNEVVEMAMAHKIKNEVEAAYRRGDLLEKRRALMNDWANFLAGQKDDE